MNLYFIFDIISTSSLSKVTNTLCIFHSIPGEVVDSPPYERDAAGRCAEAAPEDGAVQGVFPAGRRPHDPPSADVDGGAVPAIQGRRRLPLFHLLLLLSLIPLFPLLLLLHLLTLLLLLPLFLLLLTVFFLSSFFFSL